MKILVAYSGNLGSTKKAALYLAERLSGHEVVLFDTAIGKRLSFGEFDAAVFGTNIRMFRFNKRFRKIAKKWNAEKGRAYAYVYVMGANVEKGEAMAQKAAAVVFNCRAYVYAGGELSSENASGFDKKVIENVSAEISASGKEMPKIDYSALDKLATQIVMQ